METYTASEANPGFQAGLGITMGQDARGNAGDSNQQPELTKNIWSPVTEDRIEWGKNVRIPLCKG